MIKFFLLILGIGIFSCTSNSETNEGNKTGKYSGFFEHGNFSDKITFEIERDSTKYKVFFTSLEQNAFRIPFQDIEVNGDSIKFILQSDFYTYSFSNKWIEYNSKIQGSLSVDTITVQYILQKEPEKNENNLGSEEISFVSHGIKLVGTIWYPKNKTNKALVIVTSSGNADRSASRAEAMLFAQMGFTTFHYDKRGTGNSEGNWEAATMDELVADDISGINYFSKKTGIKLSEIGIKGSSQGATKVPYILNKIKDLKYGISVSCPGVTLLESDLNYWKNRNSKSLGKDIEVAAVLQRKVFEYVAGKLSRSEIENALEAKKSESWFNQIWVPDFNEVQTDKKLLYSPIPYFETTKQPILILQGTLDEIIPPNSYKLISEALSKSGNSKFDTILIEGASHSMSFTGKSDFHYWSKLHPDYLNSILRWIKSISNTN